MRLQQGARGGFVDLPGPLDVVAEQGFQYLHRRGPVLDLRDQRNEFGQPRHRRLP